MPVFWWYLLTNYLKVLALSVVSFITILLVSRLEEIAQFTALGAPTSYLLLFILNQIPYVLPIALPISCLISAFLLFQRLSQTHELTALRAGGIGIIRMMTPILCAGFFISLATFYISSEIATTSHLRSRKMVHDLIAVNPLLLLQGSKIAPLKRAFIQMDPIHNGKSIGHLLIGFYNHSQERISLCLMKQIDVKNDQLYAHQISLISSAAHEAYDHLFIENQKTMRASAKQLAFFLRQSGWKIANDHLKLRLLRIRLQQLQHQGNAQCTSSKCQSEFMRRISLGLSAFSFTLLGSVFGIDIGRHHSKKRVVSVLLFATSSLIAFCLGKELGYLVEFSFLCFFLPHLFMVATSFWMLNRLNHGVE